mmetsp:Transcript_2241/g.5131  ORF Transcript_2241/g.5131 Transcript_2241/m.5131 type:complete len:136 (-) Transcript_2241:123-530(-)|eukprot:CAMPEP_0178502524 /NCGR_PEP_ID=MMETSP0696-20121128/17549_1 /TAXON_ID=265572 /ORGANISM="Extubocellulus spinifer, Strain CCMP396" /LENGTH=135 /DNA_ID=CAMNT_0020131585 /DNA_START=30 /DNA_END=437 /DNA_ORIENTATION=-
MFASRAMNTLRGPASRALARHGRQNAQQQQRRNMGGGSHWMEVSDVHTKLGEAFGFVCWLWVFHRARNDLPVVLGWRHPWEHAEDPWAVSDHVDNEEEVAADWNDFMVKSIKPGEDDDDDDEDDDDDDDEDDDDE